MNLELEVYSPPIPRALVKCCDCTTCSLIGDSSSTWIRSVKRKYDEYETRDKFHVPGFDLNSNAKVQIENECVALREMISSQQETIQDLYVELEEERNASSSAATEAMSMILKLQREKAEIQMEARQFKCFAEEKMAHDQEELMVLDDLLYKREQAIEALTFEIRAYKHRMMSYGLTEEEIEGDLDGRIRNIAGSDDVMYDNPPPRCPSDDVEDVEQHAFGENRSAREQLRNLEERIGQMEKNPSSSQPSQLDGYFPGTKNVSEKVITGHSPRQPRHSREHSSDSSTSFLAKEINPEFTSKLDNASKVGDDTSDRVYTVDYVHTEVPYNETPEPKPGVGGCDDDYASTPRDALNLPDGYDPDIKKLCLRLQALEADRESVRQAIISMRTDKAQLVLLKEIAQNLCKEMPVKRQVTVRKPSILGSLPFMSFFKWIVSFVFWKRRARRNKYLYGLSLSNVGLLMLLDKGPRLRQWRCLSSTEV